ncbi:hypothetical protein H1O16_gp203 [Burkholderia phage BcepSaruman]|uniref:Uncharacterized protein n=1 Tax=Burkholderia phage BcepSaruman TaxID=2530032 RepID=A0A4D5ZDI2_9CAUD|nr:hypothetical protein H1O16_gp203 [Burkholderia phage BcepSaruman]QBX06616.1 hypothetical protein BcepSaruman_203 [Burkholderia phage BcepSaruman]
MPIYREGIDLDQYVSTWDEPDSVEGLGYCYRYTDVKYSPGVDEWDDPLPRSPGTHLGIHVQEYKVLRETKCGFWFYDTYEGRERFINNSWTKKYVLRSKEAARDSYIARKEKQITLLQRQIIDAKEFLRMARDQQARGVAQSIWR